MIVLINGPLGVGKSETAWMLLQRLDRGALLDVDHVAAFHPFDFYDRADIDYAFETITMLAAHHSRYGYRDLVIDWVIERPEDLDILIGRLRAISTPVVPIHLTASAETIDARIRARGRNGLEWELVRGRDLKRLMDTAAPGNELGYRIETDGLRINQVADRILAIARDGAPLPPAIDGDR